MTGAPVHQMSCFSRPRLSEGGSWSRFGVFGLALLLLTWAGCLQSVEASSKLPSVLDIKSLDFDPQCPVAGDTLGAVVVFRDQIEPLVPMLYRWHVNGDFIGESTYPQLECPIKRGDLVELMVFVGDMRDETRGFKKSVKVANSAPELRRISESVDEKGLYVAQFEVSDKDGDAVSVTLQKGPEGMAWKADTRELRWSVPQGTAGLFPVELSASDSEGATVVYSYSVTLKQETT